MDLNKTYVIDIESNGLLSMMLDFRSFPYKMKESSRLWCVVIRNVGTDEYVSAVGDAITKEWFQTNLSDAEVVVAHNGIKFDFIALKLFGVFDYTIGHFGKRDTLFGREMMFVDTLLLSRLFNPDRYKGHSLEAWGDRLGFEKMDFRAALIERELLDPKAPKGFEFTFWSDIMLDYCIQDTKVNREVLLDLLQEWLAHDKWFQPIRIETKLADIAIRRESLGFKFDKELALECLADLTQKMAEITAEINPILPMKKLNATQLKFFTPPANQVTKKGELTKHMENFVTRIGGEAVRDEDNNWLVNYKESQFKLPITSPVEMYGVATIDDLDHVKMYLIHLGWEPSEWRERDLTKDVKKQNLPYEKRVDALKRWWKDTLNGKYKKQRIDILGGDEKYIYDSLLFRLSQDRPVRVPTSPTIRVGVEKNLCPNLEKLGSEVDFAARFALYLTYKHRKSSIAGGDIEDMDFDEEAPNTGFLSAYREEDGRIGTPAIEIGASTNRYRHSIVTNISRVSSVYGHQMRSLFGAGDGYIQMGFDASGLENRVEAGYIKSYPLGEEIGKALTAERPDDLHTRNAIKLGIDRSNAKSIKYMLTYGGSVQKMTQMLKLTPAEGKIKYDEYWEAMLPLKMLKEDLVKDWISLGGEHIIGIDGRKIRTRSEHSLLNALFQSAGVICMKYLTVFMYEAFEKLELEVDPFIKKPDVCSMIEYHDECQLFCNPKLFKFQKFETKEQAEEFEKSWDGDYQISSISKGKEGYYIALPNTISKTVNDACKRVEKALNLQFKLGIEWIVGKNWADCH